MSQPAILWCPRGWILGYLGIKLRGRVHCHDFLRTPCNIHLWRWGLSREASTSYEKLRWERDRGMVLQPDDSLAWNVYLKTPSDQLLTIKKFWDTLHACNSRHPYYFLLGRRGWIIGICPGPLKNLILTLENIQCISIELMSRWFHKLTWTFPCSKLC
jgi:hypothetical protein